MSAAAVDGIPVPLRNVKGLLFDVFGTVVDWRSSVHAELTKRAAAKTSSPEFHTFPEALQNRLKGLTDDDWARFAQEWRESYAKFTLTFVPGVTEWKDIDAHHHESLLTQLERWDIAGVYTKEEIKDLSLVWHYLTPWEDSSKGLELLGARFVTSTLSNGNQSLLKDLKEYGNLGFQRLISSADFKAYKPNPKTYLGAASTLGLEPEQVALVAAHLGDLKGARSCGLKTIYVERHKEEAWAAREDLIREARDWVDLWVTEDEDGLIEVARRLGNSG